MPGAELLHIPPGDASGTIPYADAAGTSCIQDNCAGPLLAVEGASEACYTCVTGQLLADQTFAATTTACAGAPPTDAGSDAPACPSPTILPDPTCAGCSAANCESKWCTCQGDTNCPAYVQCVNQCIESDAAAPSACSQQTCAVAPYSTVDENAGQNYIACLVQFCGAECPAL